MARHADVWHAMFPASPQELTPVIAVLRERCSRQGRDPADIEWAVGIEPDALAHFSDEYLAMGFRQFTLGVNGPSYDLAPVRDCLAWRDR